MSIYVGDNQIAGTGGTFDYTELLNKPKINAIELDGELSLETLGIQAKGDYALSSTIPTKVSELTNDSGYLTEHQDISGKADKATTLAGYGITDGATTTFVADAIYKASSTVYQTLYTASNDIVLQDNVTIYKYNLTGNVTFSFNVTQLTNIAISDKIITFELYLPTFTAASTITWPTTLKWIGDEVPTIEINNNYLLAFRSFDKGVNWIGNLQCNWS